MEKGNVFSLVWIVAPPSNIQAFTWRVLLNCIQTRDNVGKRGVPMSTTYQLCPCCHGHVESCSHLLFSCPVSYDIWCLCSNWMGMSLVYPLGPNAHLLSFLRPDCSKVVRGGLLSIWMAVVWSLWYSVMVILREEMFLN